MFSSSCWRGRIASRESKRRLKIKGYGSGLTLRVGVRVRARVRCGWREIGFLREFGVAALHHERHLKIRVRVRVKAWVWLGLG